LILSFGDLTRNHCQPPLCKGAMRPEGCQAVFVEGVPFSGKSTLSEFIYEQLVLNGVRSTWISEGALFGRYFPGALEPNLTLDSLRAEWKALAEALCAADELSVVDSALSYPGIYAMLALNLTAAEIEQQFHWLRSLFEPLPPRVIYLRSNPRRTVPASIEDRGEAWREQLLRQTEEHAVKRRLDLRGNEGAIALMDEQQQLFTNVVSSTGWTTLTLDVEEGEWSERRRRVLDFLGIQGIEPPPVQIPLEQLASYSGEYESESGNPYTVVLEKDRLVLYQPDNRLGWLKPRTCSLFHLEASDVDVEFGALASGEWKMTFIRREGAAVVCRRR
jgi:hypothetical protein